MASQDQQQAFRGIKEAPGPLVLGQALAGPGKSIITWQVPETFLDKKTDPRQLPWWSSPPGS